MKVTAPLTIRGPAATVQHDTEQPRPMWIESLDLSPLLDFSKLHSPIVNEGLMSLYSALPQQPRNHVLDTMRCGLQCAPAPDEAVAKDAKRFFDKEVLSFEDIILLVMLSALGRTDDDLREDAVDLSADKAQGGQATDVQAAKFKRQVDKRNHLFGILQALIDAFKQSTDRVTQSINR